MSESTSANIADAKNQFVLNDVRMLSTKSIINTLIINHTSHNVSQFKGNVRIFSIVPSVAFTNHKTIATINAHINQ